jgi:ribosomal protein S1
MAYCEELSSKTLVIVPFSEFKTSDVDMMSRTSFKVITTLNANGAIYGSIKKYQKVESFDVLGKLHKENTPFDVKIVELVKGGFIAKYNSNVDCFLPGAHAAPNVIYNFESYIGKTVSVMVDNFDKFSNLFVVSHKKFIKNEIPKRINNLEFGKRYRGTLTSNPSKIGLFIEFEGIFTGLVHMFDFKDYNEETRHLRSGDEVDIYIKNVSIKDNGEYRINLTLNAESVDQTSLCYQEYKNKLVGGEYDYEYSEKTQQFVILSGGKPACTLNIPHNSIKKYLDVYKLVCVTDVDVIGKQVYFDFLK